MEDQEIAKEEALDLAVRLNDHFKENDFSLSGRFENGFVIPMRIHRNLGFGWIFLNDCSPNEFAKCLLEILVEHASNALYSSVDLKALEERDSLFIETSKNK